MLRSRGGRRRERWDFPVKFSALALLVVAGAMVLAPNGWAVDGGYGPGGGAGYGNGGTLNNVIVAKTVGPRGGSVVGHSHGTTIVILIPRGQFSTAELVEVTSATSSCKELRGKQVVIGLTVVAFTERPTSLTPWGASKAVVSTGRDEASLVFGIDHERCTLLDGIDLSGGHVVVPLYRSSSLVITSPSSGGGGSEASSSKCDDLATGDCEAGFSGGIGIGLRRLLIPWS